MNYYFLSRRTQKKMHDVKPEHGRKYSKSRNETQEAVMKKLYAKFLNDWVQNLSQPDYVKNAWRHEQFSR